MTVNQESKNCNLKGVLNGGFPQPGTDDGLMQASLNLFPTWMCEEGNGRSLTTFMRYSPLPWAAASTNADASWLVEGSPPRMTD